jgi:ABC-type Zn uptake system ZnuABC Zn-binding protein ZnuA
LREGAPAKSPGRGFSGGDECSKKANRLPATSIAIALLILCTSPAFSAIRIVTSTGDLADIAKSVGQNHVTVTRLTDGRQDPHEVEARPSMVNKVRQAELVVVIGMELDGWMDSILRTAGNPKVLPGKSGYLDASVEIKKLPSRVNPNAPGVGDVHKSGNPHYWLDPMNGITIADEVRDRLVKIDPENKADYDRNYEAFSQSIRSEMVRWRASIAEVKDLPVLSFHSSWDYFLRAFDLRNAGTVEVYPGMGSLGVDLATLKSKINRGDYSVLIYEPSQAQANVQLFKHLESTKLKLTPLIPSVMDGSPANTYKNLIGHNISTLKAALESAR